MAFEAPEANSGGGDKSKYENPETGSHPARCIMIIDMGTVDNDYDKNNIKKQRKMILVFELESLMKDGRPFVSNWWQSLSLAPGSNLTAILESWRGKKFDSDKERESFDIEKILDMPCMVSLVENSKGTISVHKTGVTPLMKGFELTPRVNDLVSFGIKDIGGETWDNLYPWIQTKIIELSDEGKAHMAANPGFEYGKKTSQTDQHNPADGEPTQQFEADGVTPQCPF